MKIKILVFINRNEIGTMTDLKAGEIVAIDDTIGQELINAGKAEIEF